MKLESHFRDFLADTVNLNTTRVGLLEDSVESIKNAVRGFDWKPRIRGFDEHGSWAHETIIKPMDGKPFDADLLVYVHPVEGWDARSYVDELHTCFERHGTYKDKLRRYSHCVTIEYAGERKIDVAPCVVNRGGWTRFEVCDRDNNRFDLSEPKAYTNWIIDRNTWSGGNAFRKVTRLVKYLRAFKGTFTCSSFLLTTLLADRITMADRYTNALGDVPTALRTVVSRLDDWLQARSSRPEVRNPVLWDEVISGDWDDLKYGNFRDKVHTYRTWIDDAYDEADREESIGKWRRVFGEEFAKAVVLDEAAKVSTKAAVLAKSIVGDAATVERDLVDLVRRLGARALPSGFARLPHMQRPTWRVAAGAVITPAITAALYNGRNGTRLRDAGSLDPLPKARWLRFTATVGNGLPLGRDYEVWWRVANTDREAAAVQCLRGGFERSGEGAIHWEQLAYRGVHIVEAFVVRRRDNLLVGKSQPFYVMIE